MNHNNLCQLPREARSSHYSGLIANLSDRFCDSSITAIATEVPGGEIPTLVIGPPRENAQAPTLSPSGSESALSPRCPAAPTVASGPWAPPPGQSRDARPSPGSCLSMAPFLRGGGEVQSSTSAMKTKTKWVKVQEIVLPSCEPIC